MNSQVACLAERIANSAVPFCSSDSSLLDAHEIIAKVRISNFKPLYEWITTGDFGDDDVTKLRESLIRYARNHSNHESRGMAYWGLGELRDNVGLDILRKFLADESTREEIDEHVIWQLVSGLDKIGEDILDSIDEDQLSESGRIWAASRMYLGRHPLNKTRA